MEVLRNTKGASLIFVLAVTLLLLAIGVSVLTAAGANYGAIAVQRDRSQLEIYVSSMERVLREIIEQEEDSFPVTMPFIRDSETLVGLILLDVLFEAVPEEEGSHYITGSWSYSTRTGIGTIRLPNPTGSNGENLLGNVEYDIIISWAVTVRVPEIVRCERHSHYDEFGEEIDFWVDPCINFEVEINGTLKTTITTSYATQSGNNLSMTTMTTYILDEVRVEEDDNCKFPDDVCDSRATTMGATEIGRFRISNLPERSIIRHEKGIG